MNLSRFATLGLGTLASILFASSLSLPASATQPTLEVEEGCDVTFQGKVIYANLNQAPNWDEISRRAGEITKRLHTCSQVVAVYNDSNGITSSVALYEHEGENVYRIGFDFDTKFIEWDKFNRVDDQLLPFVVFGNEHDTRLQKMQDWLLPRIGVKSPKF